MIPTRNLRITYPSSQKIYVPGEINRLKVGMRLITLSDSLVPDENGKKEKRKNNPVHHQRYVLPKESPGYVKNGMQDAKIW